MTLAATRPDPAPPQPHAEEIRAPADAFAWLPADSALLLGVLAFTALWVHAHFIASAPPIEDAAMLLRYAQNFAAGHGVRWNIDQSPVDGATDFLYMVAIGALARVAHLGVLTASRVLNLSAHFLSVLAIFAGGRKLFGANRWLCAWIACYLGGSLATNMAIGGFGAPFFAAILLACWISGLAYVLRRPSRTWAIAFGTLALLGGLTRPEGVLIAVMMLAAMAFLARTQSPRPRLAPLVLSVALMLGVLGGVYFLWRWRYFGYPLPNPFYIKGDGRLYVGSVFHAAASEFYLAGPLLALIPLGFAFPATRSLARALLIVLVPFTLMWILLNNWNNHFMRFQYAIVPLTLLTVTAFGSSFASVPGVAIWLRRSRTAVAVAAVCLLCASLLYVGRLYPYPDAESGMRVFASRLAPLAPRGYTMVVTEAGDLPFYSHWRTIDALGLNDSYIAHHKTFGDDYLDRFHPELIMVHMDSQFAQEFLQGFTIPPGPNPGLRTQEFLNNYAARHGYTLAAAFGSSPCNLHFYWLRPGFADYDEVLRDIRDNPYYFLDNGFLSFDFRNSLGALKSCALPHP
jgi:arabinofuranosyltransferase